ncbi:hypothetical protein JH146_1251 [Methanocaldococcus bathoardescens]|uniref:Uncharacterized protein n=1 Tax=Methanocaldococcus bathoardescens TaxID=1301915 RepID=A0A076LHY7_9EURY|nr:hypothetical protein [Methanocaldococcus bathoardescens]AIJ06093.1 hypothetical protein JH146_1251 [Methanocaldococcus bathoardescens]
MKNFSVISGLLAIIFITLAISQVNGLSGAITPPKIDIMANASNGFPQDVNSIIYIKNPNDFPVRVEILTTGDLNNSEKVEVKINENNFTLKPGRTVRVNITFTVKENDKYEGNILTKISPLDYGDNKEGVSLKASVVLPTKVAIMVVDSENYIKKMAITAVLIMSMLGMGIMLIRKYI